MSVAFEPTTTKPTTADEIMSLPDDGIERDLIRGELRERSKSWNTPDHAITSANVSYLISLWLDSRPKPRGKVYCGAGFRLIREPQTFVGIDIAYVSAEMAAKRDRKLKFFDGPPILAVEILSPSDQHEDIVEKVEIYLEVGTVVWIADPDFRTVSVHRTGQPVETYNDQQELIGGPELPGFRAAVAQFFDS